MFREVSIPPFRSLSDFCGHHQGFSVPRLSSLVSRINENFSYFATNYFLIGVTVLALSFYIYPVRVLIGLLVYCALKRVESYLVMNFIEFQRITRQNGCVSFIVPTVLIGYVFRKLGWQTMFLSAVGFPVSIILAHSALHVPKATKNNELALTLSGHEWHVLCLHVLDSNRVVSGSTDNRVKVWSLNSGECLATLSGHTNSVLAINSISSGLLVTASADHKIKLWNVLAATDICTLLGHKAAVSALVVYDQHLFSGSHDTTIKIWNVDDVTQNECTGTICTNGGSVCALVVTRRGLLISGGSDGIVRVWNVTHRQCLHLLTGHEKSVRALCMSIDGLLVSGSWDSSIRVCCVDNGECVRVMRDEGDKEETHFVNALAVDERGRVLSASSDRRIKVWSVEMGECVRCVREAHVVNDGGGGRVVTGGADNQIKVWNLD